MQYVSKTYLLGFIYVVPMSIVLSAHLEIVTHKYIHEMLNFHPEMTHLQYVDAFVAVI